MNEPEPEVEIISMGDMIPGTKKPGFNEKFEKFNTARNHADYQCYMILCEILGTTAMEVARDKLYHDSGAQKNIQDLIRKAEHWTSERSKVSDKLLRLMAGQEVPDEDRDVRGSVGREDHHPG